jgi:hypothetical protein
MPPPRQPAGYQAARLWCPVRIEPDAVVRSRDLFPIDECNLGRNDVRWLAGRIAGPSSKEADMRLTDVTEAATVEGPIGFAERVHVGEMSEAEVAELVLNPEAKLREAGLEVAPGTSITVSVVRRARRGGS